MVVPPIAADGAFIAVGIALLYVAADGLVRAASDLARSFGVTRVVIGLTVVAFGTSAPEMVISGLASAQNVGGIALGNVVGSNIANVGLVLGVAALFTPLTVSAREASREIGVVLASVVLVYVLALDGRVGLIDGAVLLAAMAAFLLYSYWAATRGRHATLPDVEEAIPDEERSRARNGAIVVGGLVGVGFGAWLTVQGAVGIARSVGVPGVLIGLTVVAFGTSLPELATSGVAAYRHEVDISVGNILGSNLFNTLAVLGLAAVIAPVPVDAGTLGIGIPVMAGFSLALLPFLREGFVLDRPKGAALLIAFVVFWAYLAWTGSGWVA